MNIKRTAIISLLALSFVGCAHHKKNGKWNLHKIVHGEHRLEKNKVRDIYRHPVETLSFFEVSPNMNVVEISPGAGWYTEILGPYLKDHGKYHVTQFSDTSPKSYAAPLNKKVKDMVSNKKYYGEVTFSVFESPVLMEDIGEAGSFDRVLTFRNVHNWMKDGMVKEAFEKFYKALKPGGILGIVEHRASVSKKQDPKALDGYVREDYVIDLAKSVGFEFIAKSEINANYNDKKSHDNGVWTLPPSMRGGKKGESYYQAIGESDRMTVKFRKPLN